MKKPCLTYRSIVVLAFALCNMAGKIPEQLGTTNLTSLRRRIVLSFFVILITSQLSQIFGAVRYYVGGNNGNWNTTASWSVNSGGGSGASVPGAADLAVFDGNSGSVNVNINASPGIAQLWITGGVSVTFTASGNNRTLTVGDNTLNSITGASVSNSDLVIESTSTLNITGTATPYTMTVRTANNGARSVAVIVGKVQVNLNGSFTAQATITFNSGSSYIHARNTGNIVTATWNAASNCNITGVTATAPGGLGQNFGNFTWNCTGQGTNAINVLFPDGTTIAGDLSVVSTGTTGSIILSNNTTATLNVSGSLSVSGGTLNMLIGGNNRTLTLNLGGDLSLTGGLITETSTGTGGGLIVFNKAGTQTFTKTLGDFSNSISFNVSSGSTLDMGTNILDGSGGTFTVTAGGGLILGDPNGITTSGASGNVQVSGTRTYNTGNYTYNGSSAQVTGNGLPATVTNLNINNSAGVSLSQNVTVNGDLTLQSGALSIGANTLTLANGSGLVYSAGSLTGGASSNFTIGTGTAINPLNSILDGLNNFSLSRNATLGANLSVAGNLTLIGSTLDLGSYTANRGTTGGTLSLNATSSLLIAGNNTFPANYTTNTLTAGSTVNYYGSNQNVSAQNYSNLTISGSGTKTLQGNITPGGNVTITSSTFDLGTYSANRSTPGGTLSLDATSALLIGGTGTFPSNFTTNTLTAGSTVNYNGTDQNVSVKNYSNLSLSGSGTKTLQGVITPGGNLTITGSTFDLGTFTVNRSAAGGSLNLDATSTILIGGTNSFPTNYTTNTLSAGSTVNYAGTNQSIANRSYSNLTLSGSGTKTFSSALSIGSNFAISQGTVANLGTFTTSTANTLSLGGLGQASGSWGSTSSAATNKNNTFFSATTGYIAISTGSCQALMGYGYERNISIDHTKVSGGTNLYNFPVLISLSGQSFLKNAPTGQVYSTNGYDIIFTDSNNNKLDHQLEYFNGSTGDLIAWVRITTLSASSNTVIKIQYGNPQVTTDQSVTSVWDSHYKGIWHMDNLSLNDFTSYNKSGTPRNSPTIQTGKINSSLGLDGTNQFATVLNAPNTNFSGNLTISAWIYLTGTGLDQKIAGNQNGTLGGYKFGIYSNNYLEFEIRNSANTESLNRGVAGGTLLTTGQWYYVAGISSDVLDSIKTYVNGIPERPYKKTGALAPSSDSLTIGKEPWLNSNLYFFHGYIDELRISDEFRSNGWTRTEFLNQSSPSTFYSIDASGTSLTTLPSASICSSPITFTFGYPAGGTYSGSNVTSGGVFTPPSAGTYSITYTYTSACGPVSASRDIEITPKPSAPVADNQSYCLDQITYLQATSGTNIRWYRNGALVSTANPYSTGQTVPGTYTYKVTQTVNNCESDSTTVTLSIYSGTTITAQPQATSICDPGSGSFTVTAEGTGLTYQWQESGVNISDNVIFSGTTTSTLTLTNPGSGKNGLLYRCVISTTCGAQVTSNTAVLTVKAMPVATFSYSGTPYCQTAPNPSPTFSGGGVAGTFSSTSGLVFVSTTTGSVNLLASTAGNYSVTNTIAASGGCPVVSASSPISVMTNIWTGSLNTDWNTGTNWCTGSVPAGTGYISIPLPATNHPAISSQNVTISSGATLEIMDGVTLTLSSGPVLTFQSGSTVTTGTNGKIVLQSGANYLNLGTSTPLLQAERQIPSVVKGWHMLACPVNTTFSTMFAPPVVTQGFSGSDYPALQPNLLWWNETDGGTSLQSWRTPVSLGSAITGGQGYFTFFFNGALRPAPLAGNYSDALPLTMSATGTENFNGTGNFTFNITKTARSSGSPTRYIDVAGEGWNLVGNPTASTIDWDAAGGWTKSNMDNSIYIWDPLANSGNGDYKFWHKDSTSSTLSNGRIAPFQAFWVHANAASPTLTMNNNAKISTSGTFLKKGYIKSMDKAGESMSTVVIPLMLEGLDMNTKAFVSLKNDYLIGLDEGDVYRLEPMSNTWLALYTNSSLSRKEPLVVNSLPLDTAVTLVIPLYTAASVSGVSQGGEMTLSWKIPSNWPSDLIIELMDHDRKTAISMTETTHYNFTLSAMKLKGQSLAAVNPLNVPGEIVVPDSINSGSKGSTTVKTPFSIVIKKGVAGNLPVYEKLQPLLLPLSPNPFRDVAKLSFRLPEEADVRIDIFDVHGRKIETPAEARYPAGLNEIIWTPISSFDGMFFIRLSSGVNTSTQRAIRVK